MKNKPIRQRKWNRAACVSVLCLSITHAWSQQRYWDINGSTPGAGAVPMGTWGTDAFWSIDPSGSVDTGAWESGFDAVFSAGADAVGDYTVTVNGNQLASSVTVEEGHLFLDGAAVNVGAGSVTVAPGAKLSIKNFVGAQNQSLLGTAGATLNLNGSTLRGVSNAPGLTFLDGDFTINIGQNGGILETSNTGTNSTIFTGDIRGVGNTLIKSGSGEFRYQGAKTANTTFARLIVTEGLFRLGNVTGNNFETGFGAVPATFIPDAITLSNNAAIGTSWNAADAVLHANRGITLGTGGGRFISALTVPGAITGDASLTLTAAGSNLNGLNTFTGGLVLGHATGATNIGASGGMLAQTISGTGSLTVNGVVSGTATLAKDNTGTVTLNGSNTYTGQTVASAGILNVGHANALGSPLANTRIVAGAELRIDGATKTFTLAEPLEIAGTGAGGGGAITIQNSATPTISAPVTLTGDTTITVSGVSTGTYTNPASFTSTGNHNLTLQGGAGTGGGGRIEGAISLGSGGLTKLQGGKWVLSGANTYTGVTNISAGTLQFAKQVSLYNGNAASWTATNIIVGDGGTFAINVGGVGEFTQPQVDGFLALGTATGGFLSGSSIGIDTTNAAGGQVTQGAIANPNAGANVLGLTKLGAGTLLLSATNTYTGITSVLAGVLAELPGASIADSSNLVVNGPTAEFALGANHSDTVGSVSLQGGGSITGTGTSTLTVSTGSIAAQSGSVTAILAGAGIPLDKTTTGTVTLSGANTYTGATTIAAGTLSVSNVVVTAGASNLGNASSVITLGAATTAGILSYTGNTATFTRGFDVQAGGGRIDVVNAGQTLTIAATGISGTGSMTFGGAGDVVVNSSVTLGAGGVTKEGAGTLTLADLSTYNGPTNVTAGKLLVNGTILDTAVINISGILGGDGLILPIFNGNINLLAGGKIAPGTSVGTLSTVLTGEGKVDLTAGISGSTGALQFELGPVVSSDKFVITDGPLVIGTGLLGLEDFAFTLLPGYDGGDYLLFDGNAPISGTLGPNFAGTVGGFPAELQIGGAGNSDLILHVVPEPGTAAILLAGLGALAARRRRA